MTDFKGTVSCVQCISRSDFHARKVQEGFRIWTLYLIRLLPTGWRGCKVWPILLSDVLSEHWKIGNWAQSFFLRSACTPNVFQTLKKRIEWKIFQIAKGLKKNQKFYACIWQVRQRPPYRPFCSKTLLEYGNEARSGRYFRAVHEEAPDIFLQKNWFEMSSVDGR